MSVISHYLSGELCQRCQCITVTNHGITYHHFARLYLSSCALALDCSALISSDDKETFSSLHSPDCRFTHTVTMQQITNYNACNEYEDCFHRLPVCCREMFLIHVVP